MARAYRGRGRSQPADVAARMLTYQVQGTSATRALALEREAGRGMQRQRWFALWNDLESMGVPSGPPATTEWAVKTPGGYVAFVVVMVAPTRVPKGGHANIEAIHVAVQSRRRRSQKWYARRGLELVARSTRRYRRAPIAAYVSSVAKLVAEK